MGKIRRRLVGPWVYFMALALGLSLWGGGKAALGDEAKATTKFEHNPLEYFVPGQRIAIKTMVEDPEGISLARCYFREAGQADFVFVPLATGGSDLYQGVLPAPAKGTQSIEYLFLAVNNKNVVVKTQVFTVNFKETEEVPSWQKVPGDGMIQVSTELDQAPATLAGFGDNVVMDVVESSARFGIVAGGLYAATSLASGGAGTASVSGAAASATTAGTVTAAAAGISTTAVVVGAAAVAGGAAAAGGGGGGGGGSTTSTPTPTPSNNNPPTLTIKSYSSSVAKGKSNTITYSYSDLDGDISTYYWWDSGLDNDSGSPSASSVGISGTSGTFSFSCGGSTKKGTLSHNAYLMDSKGNKSGTATATYTVY